MRTFTANGAKTRCGECIDPAQREPVRLARHDRAVDVVLSAQDCEAMLAFHADRLRRTFDQSARHAAAAGLAADAVGDWLADDSTRR